ncbi:hypothetical protein C8J56DRAFT_727357, partial [Mycena floridula]
QTPTELLDSILKQLAETREASSDNLLALHKTCESHKIRPTVPLLMAALHKKVQSYSRVYIVIDALDECCDVAQDIFVSTKPDSGLRSLSDVVQLVITSRNMLPIEQELSETRLDIKANTEDIHAYIQGRLQQKGPKLLVKGDAALEADIINQVITKAAGMFLFAQLHIDSLASKQQRKALQAELSTLPDAITTLYDSAMDQINSQGEEDSKLALQ